METTSSEAPAAAPAAPTLFLRNATGLVKGWSGFDAFVYSFMSVNLVTLGMYYSFTVFGWVTNGSPIAAILVTAVAMTFLAITYAGLVAVMPRAGGDYVWQSRILDGPPGAVAGAAVIGIGAYLVGGALGLDNTIALVLGLGGAVGGWRARAVARRDRLRARGHRLVADPRPVGADLRRDPQPAVRPAGRGAARDHGPRDPRRPERRVHRVAHRHRAGHGAGGAGHGGLRPHPAHQPRHRPVGPGRRVRA